MSGLKTSAYYPLSFKLKVVEEITSGRLSREAAKRKYGINGASTIPRWISKLGSNLTTIEDRILTNKEYQKRIKELEALLEHEKMKRISAELMIDIAEKTMKIDIRKKSDIKQSKR